MMNGDDCLELCVFILTTMHLNSVSGEKADAFKIADGFWQGGFSTNISRCVCLSLYVCVDTLIGTST